ncbi:MAG: tetratricopeptide repeat protein [Candidatus Methylomirabilales bacterium]
MSRMDTNRIKILFLLTLFPAFLYVNAISNDFLIDDQIIVDSNIRPLEAEGPLSVFAKGEKFQSLDLPYYRPLTNLSYYLDHRLWGMNPSGFHFTNLLLHILNTLLVFALASSLIGGRAIPCLAALFFTAHPVHTESLDLVQGRTDLLSGLFFLSSLLLFIRLTQRRREQDSFVLYAASLLAFFLALLSKEMAVTLPLILFLYSFLFFRPPGREGQRFLNPWLFSAPFFVVLGIYLLLRVWILGVPSIPPANLLSFLFPRLLLIPRLLITYLKLLIWPFSLTFLHSIPPPQGLSDPGLFLPLILLCLLTIGVALLVRRSKEALFAASWILVTLLPVLNLVPIQGFVLAERYLYIPSVGLSLLAALAAGRVMGSRIPSWGKGLVGVSITAVLIAFSTATVWRNSEWSDHVAIYQEMVKASPDSFFAHNNLALEYMERGEADEAIAHLKIAVALDPDNAIGYNNLGVAYARKGLSEEAAETYRRAIQIDPRYAEPYNNLGVLSEEIGHLHEAEIYYRRALQLDPQSAKAIENLARIYEKGPSRTRASNPGPS